MTELGPLVSVVTPTFPGREIELERCMSRVIELDWPNIQHVVISDRRDEQSERQIGFRWQALIDQWWKAYPDQGTRLHRCLDFTQINESWRNPTTEASIGAIPWYVGSLMAMGEFVAFCGDDDELLSHHVKAHVEAMTTAEAMFSVSTIEFRANGEIWNLIGPGPEMALGTLDATGIMCHVDALKVANWSANGENAADYRLVRDWRAAGLRGTIIPEVTGIHNDGWLVGKTGRPDRPQ